MASSKRKTCAGYIYKISHPMISGVYIGQTVKSPEQRLKEHIQEANGHRRPTKGRGAIYEVIRAFGPERFKIEEIARATTKKELNRLEAHYQEKYDSVQNGLNRIKAPQTESPGRGKIEITIDGELKVFPSIPTLCRKLRISYTSLLYWTNKKQLSLEEAVKKTIKGAKRESEKGFVCFRKPYRTFTDLAQDTRVNRHKLSGREIAARVRKGMSPEDAVSTPKRSRSRISVNVDGSIRQFNNIAAAYHALSKTQKLPSYSAIVQRIEKGEAPEEAFGFVERPWKKKFAELVKLVEQKEYKLIGALKSWSSPIVLRHTKEIFASKRDFAKTYGLEYTETSKKLKNGLSPEEILRKSGHLSH